MFSISDSAKKEFALINQRIGQGDILQVVKIAKEARDMAVSRSYPDQAVKKITEIVFTKRCTLMESSPVSTSQVVIIMTKNKYDATTKCSAKEEYCFQWDELEKTWKLVSLTETD
jgi:hypothetical protein